MHKFSNMNRILKNITINVISSIDINFKKISIYTYLIDKNDNS